MAWNNKVARSGYKFRARPKPGVMNKTEARYAELLFARQLEGEVLEYHYDSLYLRLTNIGDKSVFFRPDFFVVYADGRQQFVDVKGSKAMIEEDAKVKIKIAADKFWWATFVTAWPIKGHGWSETICGKEPKT